MPKKRIAIFGSTGSIGTQALDVIRSHADAFEVEILTAQTNSQLLIEQALEFKPNAVVIGDESKHTAVKEALASTDVKVFAGEQALEEVADFDTYDIMLAAIVGFAGLKPTLKAVGKGKTIALANKETLVVAGDYVLAVAAFLERAVFGGAGGPDRGYAVAVAVGGGGRGGGGGSGAGCLPFAFLASFRGHKWQGVEPG